MPTKVGKKETKIDIRGSGCRDHDVEQLDDGTMQFCHGCCGSLGEGFHLSLEVNGEGF